MTTGKKLTFLNLWQLQGDNRIRRVVAQVRQIALPDCRGDASVLRRVVQPGRAQSLNQFFRRTPRPANELRIGLRGNFRSYVYRRAQRCMRMASTPGFPGFAWPIC